MMTSVYSRQVCLPIQSRLRTSQVTVREQDPAVQIDILRFNPDDTSLAVGFALRDITATKGEDYFAPSGYTITFGPGQRVCPIAHPVGAGFRL